MKTQEEVFQAWWDQSSTLPRQCNEYVWAYEAWLAALNSQYEGHIELTFNEEVVSIDVYGSEKDLKRLEARMTYYENLKKQFGEEK